jgi:hypothetical protein
LSGEKFKSATDDDIFYSAILGAFVNNSFERDKTYFTLSTAAIGLLFTLVTTIGVNSWIEVILFFLSLISFCITTHHLIRIFDLNKEYLRLIVKGKKELIDKTNDKLSRYDKKTTRQFLISITLFGLFGLSMAYSQYIIKKGNKMADNIKKSVITGQDKPLADSLAGLSGMERIQQSGNIKRSLAGLSELSREPQKGEGSSSEGSESSSSQSSENNSSKK